MSKNKVFRRAWLLGVAAIVAFAACDAATSKVTKSTKSVTWYMDWVAVGYAIDRQCHNAANGNAVVDQNNVVKIYALGNPELFGYSGKVVWAAKFVAQIPSLNQFNFGGLAAHPTENKLYVLVEAPNTGQTDYLYTLDLDFLNQNPSNPGGAWSWITINHPQTWVGLGSRCDGTLTTVQRPNDATTGGDLIAFSPTEYNQYNQSTWSSVWTLEGLGLGDTTNLYTPAGDLYYGGIVDFSNGVEGPTFISNDESVGNINLGILEPYISGLAANRWRLADGSCEHALFAAGNLGKHHCEATPLYLIAPGQAENNTVAAVYLDQFDYPQPAIKDLCNMPKFCNTEVACKDATNIVKMAQVDRLTKLSDGPTSPGLIGQEPPLVEEPRQQVEDPNNPVK